MDQFVLSFEELSESAMHAVDVLTAPVLTPLHEIPRNSAPSGQQSNSPRLWIPPGWHNRF